jgi:hypothetical protein
MAIDIADAPERCRYEIRVDGELIGFADYTDRDALRVIPHVEVDPVHGGQGMASRLTAWALDDIRARGKRVAPVCPFVASYVHEHPEYGDLVARR